LKLMLGCWIGYGRRRTFYRKLRCQRRDSQGGNEATALVGPKAPPAQTRSGSPATRQEICFSRLRCGLDGPAASGSGRARPRSRKSVLPTSAENARFWGPGARLRRSKKFDFSTQFGGSGRAAQRWGQSVSGGKAGSCALEGKLSKTSTHPGSGHIHCQVWPEALRLFSDAGRGAEHDCAGPRQFAGFRLRKIVNGEMADAGEGERRRATGFRGTRAHSKLTGRDWEIALFGRGRLGRTDEEAAGLWTRPKGAGPFPAAGIWAQQRLLAPGPHQPVGHSDRDHQQGLNGGRPWRPPRIEKAISDEW